MATKKTKKKKPTTTATKPVIQDTPENANFTVVDTEDTLSEEDLAAMALQCQRGRYSYELKVYNYNLLKFAVYYKEKWYFATYDRLTHKVVSASRTTKMDEEEGKRFMRYKHILETKLRREALGIDKPVIRPKAVVATRKTGPIASANDD